MEGKCLGLRSICGNRRRQEAEPGRAAVSLRQEVGGSRFVNNRPPQQQRQVQQQQGTGQPSSSSGGRPLEHKVRCSQTTTLAPSWAAAYKRVAGCIGQLAVCHVTLRSRTRQQRLAEQQHFTLASSAAWQSAPSAPCYHAGRGTRRTRNMAASMDSPCVVSVVRVVVKSVPPAGGERGEHGGVRQARLQVRERNAQYGS